MLVHLLVHLVTSPPAAGYNVDMDGWVVYRGPPSSLFGFSVAGYTDSNSSW